MLDWDWRGGTSVRGRDAGDGAAHRCGRAGLGGGTVGRDGEPGVEQKGNDSGARTSRYRKESIAPRELKEVTLVLGRA